MLLLNLMASLMSIFDPCTSLASHLGWMVIFVGAVIPKYAFWKTPSVLFLPLNKLTLNLLSLFKKNSIISVTLFLFIMNMNLMGLLPLVFSPTSHLSFNIILSLTLWLGMMIWYLMTHLNQFLAHLTPVGSPLPLAPILVLIELVSSLIRPITLSLRLMANIMAGHMILTLVSKGVFSLPSVVSAPLFLVLIGFLTFEIGVALIQSYVFSSLMALYWEESEESSH